MIPWIIVIVLTIIIHKLLFGNRIWFGTRESVREGKMGDWFISFLVAVMIWGFILNHI